MVASDFPFWLATKLALGQECHLLGDNYQECRTAVTGFIQLMPPQGDS